MSFNNSQFEENEAVNSLLAKFHDKRANNAPPLGINLLEAQKIQNQGFPYWMHRSGFAPVHVMNQNQADAMAARGYVRNYTKQAYPTTLYRRNTEMVRQLIPGSTEYEMVYKHEGGVETLVVDSESAEEEARTKPTPWMCSDWFKNAADLPQVDDGPKEDPRVTIARLQERLRQAEGGEEEMTPAQKRKATLAAKAAAAESQE